MENNIEFVVRPELLGAIKNALGREISGISPFHYGSEGSQAGVNELVSAGICNPNGSIVDNYLAVIDALATPRGFTRLYFNSGVGHTFEYINYFTSDGRTVSITNDEGSQKINYPDINDKIIEGIGQNIGDSIYRSLEFDEELSHGEALVLAAMLDLQRRSLLKTISDDKEITPIKISKDKVINALSNIDGNYQWLTNIIAKILEPATTEPQEIFSEAMDGLMAKGLVYGSGKSYVLDDNAFFISRRMLTIDKTLTITSGKLSDEGELDLAGFTCLQTGIHDILMIDAGPDSVSIKTLSSSALLDLLFFFLKGDFLQAEYEVENVQQEVQASSPSPPVPPAPSHQYQQQQAPPPQQQYQQAPPPQQSQQPQHQQHGHTHQQQPQGQYPSHQQAPPPQHPPKPQSPAQFVTCTTCGQSATHISQHDRWFCYKCNKYL